MDTMERTAMMVQFREVRFLTTGLSPDQEWEEEVKQEEELVKE